MKDHSTVLLLLHIYIYSMHQDRLSTLEMLYVERNFVMNVANFNNKVIKQFANSKKEDFTCKNY